MNKKSDGIYSASKEEREKRKQLAKKYNVALDNIDYSTKHPRTLDIGTLIGPSVKSEYGGVEVIVVSTNNPRQKNSRGFNNWNKLYPSPGKSFKIQDILDKGSRIDHIHYDLSKGFTLLKNPDDIELFKGNSSIYNGIKEHQEAQKTNSNISHLVAPKNDADEHNNEPLNQILYGPPGTGKTYETKSIAVKIITGEDIKERKSLNKKYNELVSKKRIEFITFHQSYGYEDFVEGIKPKLNKETGGGIQYEIKKGILRQICDRSNPSGINIPDIIENKDVKVWSMRLASSQYKYNFDWAKECFNDANNCIMVRNNPQNKNINDIKCGDVVVVPVVDTGGKEKNKLYCGLGVVMDHECFDYDSERWARKVEWIWYDTNSKNYKNISNIWLKEFGQNPIYELRGISKKELLIGYYLKHVLIIDEINRGNISKILGELITLLEEDKRLGKDEALEVTLPYSNERFGVPSNLYIIGTMNTSDRSIAFLDTALRRRFNFTEMMPKYIKDNGDHIFPDIKTSVGVIDISKMLEQINIRICEELDRDHQIGHSYFISANKSEEIEWLKRIFMNNICPLLDECFYDRRSKINVILKDSGLITNTNNNDDYWEWADDTEFDNPKNYQIIYE